MPGRVALAARVAAVALLPFWQAAHAAPVVSGVAGTLTDGQSVTVNGSAFGTKPVAAPFLWDNFETGILGNQVAGTNGWVEYEGASHKFSDVYSYSGNRSAQNHTTTQAWFNAIGRQGLNSDEMYASFYVRWRKYSGTYSGGTIQKFFRANTGPDFYSSQPGIWFTLQPAGSWFYAGGPTGEGELPQQTLDDFASDGGGWRRFEVYWKLSTPGVPDGAMRSWMDFQPGYVLTNHVTRPASVAAQKIDNFTIPAMNDEQGGNVYFDYFVDDVYVDVTPKRVEICSTSSWASRSHCEIQIPQSWSDTSITVQANLSKFSPGSTAYVYVVDSTNTPNATGFAVNIGSGGGSSIDVAGNVAVGSTVTGDAKIRLRAPTITRVPR